MPRGKKVVEKDSKVVRVPQAKKVKGEDGKTVRARKVKLTPGEGFLDDEGRTRLTRQDLLEVEVLRLKVEERKRAAQSLHLKADQMELNTRLSVRALRTEAVAMEKQSASYQDEQALLFNKLSKKYKVDFKKATYDDETGIITVIEDSPEKIPDKK